MKKFFLGLILVFLSSFCLAVVEYGQLLVSVVDENDQPLPGVSVTIESPAMMGTKTLLTNEKGEALFIQLKPGEYTVSCQIEGWQPAKYEKNKVSLDRTTKLIVKMQPSEKFKEEVVVVGQAPVVDPTQTNTGDVFDSTYLQETAIGSGGRSYQSVLAQTGGVAGGANPSVLGSTLGENNYLIDGLSTTDPVTATFGTNFNFDAIQEISFQTGGFEAEYGQATGGIVNVITKSGGNTFDGSFDVRYSNENFYEGSDKYPVWEPYDPGRDKTWFYNPAFSLGGPIIKDKVWFFFSVQTEQSEQTPAGLDYSYKWDGQNYMGKVTWQISPNDTLIGKYSSDPAKIHNWNVGNDTAKEAGARQDQGGDIYQLDYSKIFSNNLLFTFKIGINNQYLDAYPESGDLNTPPITDYVYVCDPIFTDQCGYITYSRNNYYNAQYSERDRKEALFSLTYFKNNLVGDHTFKFGGEYHDVLFGWYSFTPGDRSYYYLDYTGDGVADPYFKYVYERIPKLEYKGKQWTLYLQDEWRLLPNLTVKPGLRYDVATYWNEAKTYFDPDIMDYRKGPVADFKKWQARIGFAWDIFNDAKTVLRGYYGRFMHPSALTLPEFLSSRGYSYTFWYSAEYYAWSYGMTPEEVCEVFGPCDEDGYIHYDPYDVNLSPNKADPNLRPTYADQYSIGIEREIFPRTGLELTYVQKRTKDILEDSCGGYDQNGNFIDPIDYIDDPSSWPNYLYDKCQFFYMRNNPYALRYYYGYILKLESRYKDWFHIKLDYTYSKAYESVGYTQNAGYDFDLPIHYINRYGYASLDNRHYVKLNGYFFLPYDFSVGFNAFFRTGRPYTKYVDRWGWDGDGPCDPGTGEGCQFPEPPTYGAYFPEKRGSYRLSSVWWIDFQVSKGFKIAEGVNAKAILSINNLTNNEFVLARNSRWNSTDPNDPDGGKGTSAVLWYDKDGTPRIYPLDFGDAIAWMTPRSYEIGFRVEF